MDADAGVLAVLTQAGDELEVIASRGYPVEACMGPGRRWPAAAEIPIAEAVRSGQAVCLGSPEEWAERYAMGYVPRSMSSAWCAVPIRPDGRAMGAILWTYYVTRRFSADEIDRMEHFAQAVSRAVKRVTS